VSTYERVVLSNTDHWASCSKREFGPVGDDRHIVRYDALTTVCGTTASHPSIWRGDTKKPRCKQCVKRYRTREEQC